MGYLLAFRNVYKEIQLQKRFSTTFLIPYLTELEIKYNGHFQTEQRRKIIQYYGLFITSFLCSSYKRLCGKTLSDAERKRATLFGILTPVGDDLFDVDKLDLDSIYAITFQPENYTAATFSAHVAKEIQTYLLQHVPDVEAYLQASADVLTIQAETIKQTSKDISINDLQRITYTKGAVSVVIYHQCLNEPAGEQMLDALFYIGSLYQLGNDLFDLYKDVRDNIYTLVNTCTDFKVFKQQFLHRVAVQNEKIMLLPYNDDNKKEFCIIMNAINARSLVAIDQFIRIQQKKGHIADWWQMTRKEMIVDMERPRNFLKWLYYIYKLPLIARPRLTGRQVCPKVKKGKETSSI